MEECAGAMSQARALFLVPATRTHSHDAHGEPPNSPHAEDLSLVEQTLAKHPDAIDRFVVRMGCVPRFVAARNARSGRALSRDEESDLVQDVLTIVWRKLGSYAGEAALETWVFQFCEFEMRNALRKRERRRMASLDESPQSSALARSLESKATASLDLEAIYRGLETLEPADRAIVRLKHFDAMTLEAIGRRLGVSLNTIKSRYYRGLEKLRAKLRAEADAP